MQLHQVSLFALLTSAITVMGKMHHLAACIGDVQSWGSEINVAATKCACDHYRARNTGSNWWDTCPDCVVDDANWPYCSSQYKHIGGDEITYYCENLCGANGAISEDP